MINICPISCPFTSYWKPPGFLVSITPVTSLSCRILAHFSLFLCLLQWPCKRLELWRILEQLLKKTHHLSTHSWSVCLFVSNDITDQMSSIHYQAINSHRDVHSQHLSLYKPKCKVSIFSYCIFSPSNFNMSQHMVKEIFFPMITVYTGTQVVNVSYSVGMTTKFLICHSDSYSLSDHIYAFSYLKLSYMKSNF